MKSIVCIAAVLALASPLTTFAQGTNQQVTRAQVKAELVQLESVGYQPNTNDLHYPRDIQAAEAKVDQLPSARESYGGAADGTTASSPRVQAGVEGHSIYFGH
ncbi:uncharacterized protein DUF4148 [Paraburkholderia sp. BL8N3]|jgi:hypothetical protein|nr:DUF4148 domain-containing protein [Paraburkholderia sp. BL8N3]TCK36831.1 uncharacterized protein DUF4148 [Paraburkholderia sp. BL8N3]